MDRDNSDITATKNPRAENDQNGNGQLRKLVEMATSMMQEAQVLARDKAFADELARLQEIEMSKGFDFYAEVERFERALIKVALDQAAGNQSRAAKLLGLRATTLNSKIRLYGIRVDSRTFRQID